MEALFQLVSVKCCPPYMSYILIIFFFRLVILYVPFLFVSFCCAKQLKYLSTA